MDQFNLYKYFKQNILNMIDNKIYLKIRNKFLLLIL
jgi:hypothetical protein